MRSVLSEKSPVPWIEDGQVFESLTKLGAALRPSIKNPRSVINRCERYGDTLLYCGHRTDIVKGIFKLQ